ncbi:single-stranded DNA-binding protein [Parapedobacter defluvii]|uniref:Single-stranded DNA-binding protein n=1 Tax=Parapedobacter defluvii TaxID=2045106 RepID=A0ABQ1LF90_9SPHI|nr:single-stranded DNA-binding protein [Parapedobacter defluvii]RQP11084.1 MAG: single-stranded DNA-binding protein [Parapedobacter sp.]GGC23031.1 single-stranded DNA-binding protein [Parapedobacter defluvii]
MSGINKVILVGHLGKDPEIRHLEGNVTVASFPLATSEMYNKDGRRVEQTEWHNIVMWRGLAEVAAKYLFKGKLVYVEGKLRTRTYEDKGGVRRYTTEVVADNFTLLGRKSDFENPVNATDDPAAKKVDDANSEPEVDFKENDGEEDSLF